MWLRSVKGKLAGDHITEVVELRNISEGGLAVHSESPLQVGELVMLGFELPAEDDTLQAMRLKCQIRHVTAEGNRSGYSIGLAFHELSAEDASWIRGYIERNGVEPQAQFPRGNSPSIRSNLVDHIVTLTQFRERDRINTALVNGLVDLLNPIHLTLYGVALEEGERFWLPVIHRERGSKDSVVNDPLWVLLKELRPLTEVPRRQECLESLDAMEMANFNSAGHCLSYFPLFDVFREDSGGIVEVLSEKPLSEEDKLSIEQMLRVYRNMFSMLDYSECDALTGLLNRKSFEDALFHVMPTEAEQAPERRRDANTSYWMGMVDVDHFKQVNDVHGHSIGDEVLLLVGRTLRTNLRSLDRVFRFGGEEFVFLIRCTDEEAAMQTVERLRIKMENTPFPRVGQVTVSVGLTAVRFNDSPTSINERADLAVYYAKQHGRNQVQNFDVLERQGLLKIEEKEGEIELF
jgi:diguanylate cyclase (GGDEF)-like protein